MSNNNIEKVQVEEVNSEDEIDDMNEYSELINDSVDDETNNDETSLNDEEIADVIKKVVQEDNEEEEEEEDFIPTLEKKDTSVSKKISDIKETISPKLKKVATSTITWASWAVKKTSKLKKT